MGYVLQKFTFIFRHQAGLKNPIVDALGRHTHLLVTLKNEITEFEALPDLYAAEEDFEKILKQCQKGVPPLDYQVIQGYLFKGNSLYLPRSSLRE